MSTVLRRLLLVAACALALAGAGCVEITNPQFDARYRSAVRPVPKLPYAVFAVYHDQRDQRRFLAGEGRDATILVVDTAKGSVVASTTLEDVVALSDVGGPGNAVLAVLPDGFAQVSLPSADTTLLPATALPDGLPKGAAFDDKGIRMFWQSSGSSGIEVLVTRRIGANEQSASVDFRDFMPEGAPVDRAADTLTLVSANDREAYFVAQGRPVDTRRMLNMPRKPDGPLMASLWRADFATGSMTQSGTAAPWPAGFVLEESVHAERAVRRWGVPVETADGGLGFVDLDGTRHSMPVTSTISANGVEIVFEPGGVRYLQIRRLAVPFGAGSVAWAVAERSMTATGTRIVFQQEFPTPGRIPIDPLGVIADELFAFGVVRPDTTQNGESSASAGGSGAVYDLHLRGIATGTDAIAASVQSVSGSPRADYLGSFMQPE